MLEPDLLLAFALYMDDLRDLIAKRDRATTTSVPDDNPELLDALPGEPINPFNMSLNSFLRFFLRRPCGHSFGPSIFAVPPDRMTLLTANTLGIKYRGGSTISFGSRRLCTTHFQSRDQLMASSCSGEDTCLTER